MQAVHADTSSTENPEKEVTLLLQAKKTVYTLKAGKIKSKYGGIWERF